MAQFRMTAYVLDDKGDMLTFERFKTKDKRKVVMDMEFLLSHDVYKTLYPNMKTVEIYTEPDHVKVEEYAIEHDAFGVVLK